MAKKKRVDLEKFRRDLIKELKNPHLWFFIGAMTIFLLFRNPDCKYANMGLALLAIVTHLNYIRSIWNKDDKLLMFSNISYALVNASFLMAYVFSLTKQIGLAVYTLAFAIGYIFLYFIIDTLIKFFNTDKKTPFWILVLLYLFTIFVINGLFGYLFALSATWTGSGFQANGEMISLSIPWEHVYFALQVFYTNTFGDANPVGWTRFIVSIELVASALIHASMLWFLFEKRLATQATVHRSSKSN